MQNRAVDGRLDYLLQVFQIRIGPDLPHASADIGWDQVEKLLCRRGEAADAEVIADHHHGDVDIPK